MANNLNVQQGLPGDPKMRTTESPATVGAHLQNILAGNMKRTYDGVQSLTLTGSSQALTVPGNATHADIYCDGTSADICRYWHFATAPTSSVGKRLSGDQEIPSADPAGFRGIVGGGSPVLRIEYYHYD